MGNAAGEIGGGRVHSHGLTVGKNGGTAVDSLHRGLETEGQGRLPALSDTK